MDSYVPPLITTCIILSLTLLFLTVRFRVRMYHRLLLLCFATLWWHGSWVFLFLTKNQETAEKIAKFGHVGILYLPIAYQGLFNEFLHISRLNWITRHAIYAIFVAFLLGSNLIVSGVHRNDWGFYPAAGPLHVLFLLFVFFIVAECIVRALIRLKHTAEPLVRKRFITNIVAGSVFALGSYDFLINYNLVTTYPIGFLSSISFILIVSFGLVKYDLFSKDEEILKSLAKETLLTEEVREKDKSLLALQASVIQQEKLASLGLVASGIAHQLGNSLNIISTNLIAQQRSLKAGSLDTQSFLEDNLRMRDALKLSKDIINSINAINKSSTDFSVHNLRSIVDIAIVFTKGKVFENSEIINLIPESCEVFCNKSSVIQIFMNLLSNSVDAVQGIRGKITIELVSNDKKNLTIELKDNGCGIPAHVQKSIFTPFTTSKFADKGTGLGLYIAKKEVDNNNGSIDFQSSDSGTTFFLTFPISEVA